MNRKNVNLSEFMKEYSTLMKKEITPEYSKVISELKTEVRQYDKNEILKWLSGTGVLPGNELYEYRFAFLIYLVASIPDNKFMSKKIDRQKLIEIIAISEKLGWEQIEDYEPFINSKKQVFGLNQKQYNYFHANLEDPIGILENICKRFHEFGKKIEKIYGYSPLDELEKLLNYQTFLMDAIGTKTDYIKYKKIRIPKKVFIDRWMEALKKAGTPFSDKFSKGFAIDKYKDFLEESVFSDLDELLRKPIINGIIYSPHTLILSFKTKLLQDISDVFNKDDENVLRNQLLGDTWENLVRLAPPQTILHKFKINDIEHSLDFGIIYDNNFFIFQIIEDTFLNKKNILIRMQEVQELFTTINREIENSDIELKSQGQKFKVEGEIVPYFIIIIDDFIPKKILISNKIGSKNLFVLENNCLQYISEDILFDNYKDLAYLAKVFDVFVKLSKHKLILCYNFGDFYVVCDSGGQPIFNDNLDCVFIDPHAFSYALYDKYATSPKLDYRPYDSFPPHSFKLVKISEYIYSGTNVSLGLGFYGFITENVQIYFIHDQNIMVKKDDVEIALFLCHYFTFFLEDFKKNNLMNDMRFKKIVALFPIEFAIKKKMISKKIKTALFAGLYKDKGLGVLIYDAHKIFKTFNRDSKIMLESILNLLQNNITRRQFCKLEDRISICKPDELFKLSLVPGMTKTGLRPHPLYPTLMDEIDLEIKINKFIMDKYAKGVYKRDKANDIVRILYSFLIDEMKKNIRKYDLKSFVELAYKEQENGFRLREFLVIRAHEDNGLKRDYDVFKELSDEEKRLQWYSPSCRYLIEEALALNISGDKKVTIKDWRTLTTLSKRIITLSNIRTFLHYLPDYLDIKLEISSTETPYNLIIEENYFEKYNLDYINNVKKGKNDSIDDQNNLYEESNELNKVRQRLFEEGPFADIEKSFLNNFGFGLKDYLLIINSMTHLQDKTNAEGLIRINIRELINILIEKTKIERNTIKKVIEFSKLSTKSFTKEPEPHKVTTRENRLIIKPLVELEDCFVAGPATIWIFCKYITNLISDGDWIYSRNDMSYSLRKALDKRKQYISREFEKEMAKQLRKYADFVETNIYRTQRKNNKCFSNISEACPGEIDILSIHKDKKKIIIWEAKNIRRPIGSQEIVNQLREFESKHINKLKSKTDYVKRNLKSILEYFEISDTVDWSVESTFILSDYSIIKYLLIKHTKIVIYDEIEKFID